MSTENSTPKAGDIIGPFNSVSEMMAARERLNKPEGGEPDWRFAYYEERARYTELLALLAAIALTSNRPGDSPDSI